MFETTFPARPQAPLPVGISQCLLGEAVRYDGTGARSSMPHAQLDGLFDYRHFCPELAIGMGVPRDPIRLVGDVHDVRVVGVKDPTVDKTDELIAYAHSELPAIAGLSGYIFMHNSPSCGLSGVKLYPPPNALPNAPPNAKAAAVSSARIGRGVFAATVVKNLPHLPVVDAGHLFDDAMRENFVTRVFAYAHWQQVCKRGTELQAADLLAFHSRYKYLLLAHSNSAYRAAGRLLSNLRGDIASIGEQYIGVLMQGLCNLATAKGHANVMSHLQGYLKNHIDSASRQELAALIDAYRRGEQPLSAPLALLRHHFQNYPDEYVLQQSYLAPHPAALPG